MKKYFFIEDCYLCSLMRTFRLGNNDDRPFRNPEGEAGGRVGGEGEGQGPQLAVPDGEGHQESGQSPGPSPTQLETIAKQLALDERAD